MSYVDGYLIPLETSKIEEYISFSRHVAEVYREHGAMRVVDCQLDRTVVNDAEFHAEQARQDLDAEGTPLRDFETAAATQSGETVILSWTEWPSKEARDIGLAKALADPRIQPKEGEKMLFEGRRLIAGGFLKLIDV
ncbi:DUF1428 domain-containing protein [Mesorhizobium sp. ANAO-SY3R2]|uniref:DUF1428 domain-containing protein n=1 Tax=Mesorhizobium sp. ANAO-SY3R2 TaxID=3166644 RepID=UPI00366BAB76